MKNIWFTLWLKPLSHLMYETENRFTEVPEEIQNTIYVSRWIFNHVIWTQTVEPTFEKSGLQKLSKDKNISVKIMNKKNNK